MFGVETDGSERTELRIKTLDEGRPVEVVEMWQSDAEGARWGTKSGVTAEWVVMENGRCSVDQE